MQNLLLSLGVLLLVVAALIFTAVAWGRIPIGGRTAIMLAVTAGAAGAAAFAQRRGLQSTAEALSTLAVVLALVDAYAVRRLGLGGADELRASTYWAIAVATVTALAAGYSTAVAVRATRFAATVGAQLPLPIIVLAADSLSAAAQAGWLAGQAAAVAVAVTELRRRGLGAGERYVAAAGGLLAWLGGAAAAAADGFGADPRVGRGAAALVGLAAVAALTAWLARDDDLVREGAAGTAAATLLVAATALARRDLTADQLPAAVAGAALLLTVASGLLPLTWRRAPLAVSGGAVGLTVLAVLPDVATALAGPFGWLGDPWSLHEPQGARAALMPEVAWGGTVVVLVVLLVAIATAVLVSELAGRRDLTAVPVGVTAALAVLLVPLGQAWSYHVAVGWDVAAGAGLVAAAVALRSRRPRLATPLYAGGVVVLAVACAWSLAHERTTLVAVAATAVLLAGAAVADLPTRLGSAALATGLAGGWVFAMATASEATPAGARYWLALAGCVAALAGSLAASRSDVGDVIAGTGVVLYVVGLAGLTFAAGGHGGADLSTSWLAGALGTGAATAAVVAALPGAETLRRVPAATAAAALGCLAVAATASAQGRSLRETGLALALAGCATVGVGAALARVRAVGDAVEAVGGVAHAGALLLSTGDLEYLSWALLAGALTALADAVRPERRWLAWVGGALLSAWSWSRLWLADVRAPEAYAAPVAITALVLGHLRRRQQAGVSSWQAYGPGLSAGLLPSLVVAVDDPGLARPLLLGAAALAVVLYGARERLQAPLVLGGVTLAVDAVVQVAPYAAGLPRWVAIGAAGLVLVGLGATYEQRRRDLALLREQFDALT